MLKPPSSSMGYGLTVLCVVLDGMGRSLIVLVLLKVVAGWLEDVGFFLGRIKPLDVGEFNRCAFLWLP